MTNRRMILLAFAAVAFITALSPVSASAQEPWWETIIRNRNDRRGDDYYRNRRAGRISDHERRILRDAARRISDRSRSFQRNVDRALDDSRYDDTRREDRINDHVRTFRDAAERFRNAAGDSNQLSRSADEARELLRAATRVDRLIGGARLDSRARSDWNQIRSDLRTVADFYGYRLSDYDDGRNGRGRDRRDNRRNWPY